jgi:hypothetical protein
MNAVRLQALHRAPPQQPTMSVVKPEEIAGSPQDILFLNINIPSDKKYIQMKGLTFLNR